MYTYILFFCFFLAEYVFYGNNFGDFKFVVVLDLYSCNWVLLHRLENYVLLNFQVLKFIFLLVVCRPEDLRGPFGQFGPLKDIYLPRDYYTG